MLTGIQIKRVLAVSTALSVVALGATTTAASAAPGNGKSQDKSHDRAPPAPAQPKSHGGGQSKDRSTSGSSESSHGGNAGHQGLSSHESGQTKSSPSKGGKDKGGKDKNNVGGNNGTVKIDGWTLTHGTGNGAPNRNEPHVDCMFDVEWYNFDASVTSTVTFAMQAPTADVELGGYNTSVTLDDDGASGANAAGLDAVEPYELDFTGEPHPKHGYHVKLTVNTPESNGADVKHKVFWVEPCEETETPEVEDETETPETPETPEVEDETGTPEGPEVAGEEGTDEESDNDSENELGVEVLGQQGNSPQVNGQEGAGDVPSAVDAGLGGADTVSPMSSLPLLVTLYGALLAGLAMIIRRRRA